MSQPTAVTGVVIMVPEAKTIVPAAHITLLAPFADQPTDGELAELEDFFAEQAIFDFELTGVSQFPGGERYLVPEPAARFSRLAHTLQRLFPEYPAYEGRFELLVPHLTIPDDAVVGPLPLRSQAREATLLRREGDLVTELAAFPLGRSAA